MEDTIESKVITIEEIEQKTGRIVLKEGRDKYSFWMKKKDGSSTKAFEAWEDVRPALGDQVDIQFKSEEASFTGDKGTPVNYTRRTILNLRPAGGAGSQPKRASSVASAPSSPGAEYVTRAEYEERIGKMSQAFMGMREEIDRVKKAIGLTDEDGN